MAVVQHKQCGQAATPPHGLPYTLGIGGFVERGIVEATQRGAHATTEFQAPHCLARARQAANRQRARPGQEIQKTLFVLIGNMDCAPLVPLQETLYGTVPSLAPTHPGPGVVEPVIATAEVLGVRTREKSCDHVG
jgi:hypothetical protein